MKNIEKYRKIQLKILTINIIKKKNVKHGNAKRLKK